MGLAEDLNAAWNAHDPEKVASMYADDGAREEFIITQARAVGREAIADQVRMYMEAMPDLALSIRDETHSGWCAIALPLRWLDDAAATGADPRPKLVLLAEHDEFRPAGEVRAVTSTWTATRTEVIGGASHFFVGRTARLIDAVDEWIAGLC